MQRALCRSASGVRHHCNSKQLLASIQFKGNLSTGLRRFHNRHSMAVSASNNWLWSQEKLFFSTATTDSSSEAPPPPTPRYAIVHHGAAYEAALAGKHGHQLELAKMEGYGKDDELFDPFAMDEEIDTLLDEAIRMAAGGGVDAAEVEEALAAEKIDDDDDTTTVPPEEMDDSQKDADDAAFAVKAEATTSTDQPEDNARMPSMYHNDGSIRRKKSQLAMLRAGYPGGGLFAVVALAGTQHKVTTDDVLIVNLLLPVSKFAVGSIHTLRDEDVLLVGSSHFTALGMPYVPGAEVDVMVEEITKDAKLVIFKKRRRKHSRRRNGFRRDVTMLRILDIRVPEALRDQEYTPRIEPDMMEEEEQVAAA